MVKGSAKLADGSTLILIGLEPENMARLREGKPICKALVEWGVQGRAGLSYLLIAWDTPELRGHVANGTLRSEIAQVVAVSDATPELSHREVAVCGQRLKLCLYLGAEKAPELYEVFRKGGLIGPETEVKFKGYAPGTVVSAN